MSNTSASSHSSPYSMSIGSTTCRSASDNESHPMQITKLSHLPSQQPRSPRYCSPMLMGCPHSTQDRSARDVRKFRLKNDGSIAHSPILIVPSSASDPNSTLMLKVLRIRFDTSPTSLLFNRCVGPSLQSRETHSVALTTEITATCCKQRRRMAKMYAKLIGLPELEAALPSASADGSLAG